MKRQPKLVNGYLIRKSGNRWYIMLPDCMWGIFKETGDRYDFATKQDAMTVALQFKSKLTKGFRVRKISPQWYIEEPEYTVYPYGSDNGHGFDTKKDAVAAALHSERRMTAMEILEKQLFKDGIAFWCGVNEDAQMLLDENPLLTLHIGIELIKKAIDDQGITPITPEELKLISNTKTRKFMQDRGGWGELMNPAKLHEMIRELEGLVAELKELE